MPPSGVRLLFMVLTAWESLFTGGIFLGLWWLVNKITVFDGKPGVYYRDSAGFSGSGAGKGPGGGDGKKKRP